MNIEEKQTFWPDWRPSLIDHCRHIDRDARIRHDYKCLFKCIQQLHFNQTHRNKPVEQIIFRERYSNRADSQHYPEDKF